MAMYFTQAYSSPTRYERARRKQRGMMLFWVSGCCAILGFTLMATSVVGLVLL